MPMETIVKLNLFEKTVSPPQRKIENFFCSWWRDFEIFLIFFFENFFLLPEPEIK